MITSRSFPALSVLLVLISLSCRVSGSPVDQEPDPQPSPPIAVAEIATQGPFFTLSNVTFNASGSTDTDDVGDGALTYEWQWESEGEFTHPSSTPVKEHSWLFPGTYEVDLRVTDDDSQTDNLDEKIVIEVRDSSLPYPEAGSSSTTGIVFDEIEFYDAGSYVKTGDDVIKFEWDWDNDGIFDEEGERVSHYWPDAGTYQIGYRVTSSVDKSSELNTPLEVQISDVFPEPVELHPGWANIQVSDFYIRPPYIFTVDNISGFSVFDISSPDAPIPVTTLALPDISYEFCVEGNFAYIGDHLDDRAIEVIDISDPTSPVMTGMIPGTNGFKALEVMNGYIYCQGAHHDLYVVNVNPGPSYGNIKVIDEYYTISSLVARENVILVCGTTTNLRIYSTADPWNPSVVQDYYFDELLDFDIDTVSWNVYCALEDKVQILKLGSIDIVAELPNPFSSSIADIILSDDQNHLYFSTRHNLSVADVSDPESPGLLSSLPTSIHPSRFQLDGNSLYAMSRYSEVFHVFDITNPSSMYQVAQAEAIRDPADIVSIGDYGFVADYQAQLDVLDTSRTENLLVSSLLLLPVKINELQMDGDCLLAMQLHRSVNLEQFPFYLFDVSDPENTLLLNTIDIGYKVVAMELFNGHAYFVDSTGVNVSVWDIDPPGAAHHIGVFNTQSYVYKIHGAGEHLYLASDSGVEILDPADPVNPSPVSILDTSLTPEIEIFDNRLFALVVSAGNYELLTADISNPDNPVIKGSVIVGAFEKNLKPDLSFGNGYIYLSLYDSGIDCFDVHPPESPFHVLSIPGKTIENIDVHGNTLHAACHFDDLRRFLLW